MANVTTLIAEVIRLLNESDTSSVGEVGNGSGTVTVDTTTTITDYLNEAIKETCRTCLYVPAKGTVTQTEHIINLSDISCLGPYVPTAPNTVNDATALWFPLTVQAGSTNLVHCSEPTLRAYSPSYETDATGTPKYWFRQGNYNIQVYPKPTASTVFTVYGAGVVGNIGADTLTIIPDDLQLKMWASYAAYKIALKNTDDPSVAQRAFWSNWYNESRMRLWGQLDTFLKMPGSPFAIPPVLGGQG
jgi:hypothetical protein